MAQIPRISREWMMMRPFGGYGLIVVDPPWQWDAWSSKGLGKSPQAHYDCTPLDWIKALPVRDALAGRDCLLWLWATNPMLPQAIEVMAAWGFTYCTAGHWSKRTKNGKQAFGGGYVLRCAGEPFLIGKVGAPKVQSKSVRSVIEARIGAHSEKPDAAFEAARALIPEAPAIEVFSRKSRTGWDTWGNETGKLDA